MLPIETEVSLLLCEDSPKSHIYLFFFLQTHHLQGTCVPEEQQCGPENKHRH